MVARVPVIRVEMAAPWECGYYGMEDHKNLNAGGFGNFVKRTGYSIVNHLPYEVNSLIDAVISQKKVSMALFAKKHDPKDKKGPPPANIDDWRAFNQYFIDALNPLMEKIIRLQDYYKDKSGVPVAEGRWTANPHPLTTGSLGKVDENRFNQSYTEFMHHYDEFEKTIWNHAKTNNVREILKETDWLFIPLLNLQNYYLELNGDYPIWTNPVESPSVHLTPGRTRPVIVPYKVPPPPTPQAAPEASTVENPSGGQGEAPPQESAVPPDQHSTWDHANAWQPGWETDPPPHTYSAYHNPYSRTYSAYSRPCPPPQYFPRY